MKKKIILVLGDPNSINSEIIFKSFKKIKNNLKNRIYLIANFDLIKKQFKILNYRIKLVKVKDLKQKPSQPGLKIIDVNLSFKNPFNVSLSKSSKFVLANSSITFPIAEGLNKPRLLESCPDFPAAQPHGPNAYNFYFQSHFEKIFNDLYNSNIKI